MTHDVARASQFSRKTRRRAGAVWGALMLGVGMLALAPPAAAECSALPVRAADTTALGLWWYTCYAHCQVQTGPVLANFTLVGRDEALFCRARCAQNHRCRAVSWHDEWVVVDGRRVVHRHCTLYGDASEVVTGDSYAPPWGTNTHVTCILDLKNTPHFRTPDPRHIDLDILDRRDRQRPGVPGPFKK